MDIHFHGAFGIDLMSAGPERLDELACRLWENGIAAFCPTTLSVTSQELAAAVERLGRWTREKWNLLGRSSLNSPNSPDQGAIPLGLHLEGPFIHPDSRGAHPPGAIRPLDFQELDRLWELSCQTLKILTIAPETLSPATLRKLINWSKPKKILLSLGHSRATEEQADLAFSLGFSGVTHAWNALPFHHRSPGPLGAALGRSGTYVELIIDQEHLSPTLIRWTRQLHGKQRLCFVSDCVPAAETSSSHQAGPWSDFGPLRIRQEGAVCRLADGALAGGGRLLTRSIGRWIEKEAEISGQTLKKLLQGAKRHWSSDPLEALKLNASLKKKAGFLQIQWQWNQGHLQAVPRRKGRASHCRPQGHSESQRVLP